MESEAARYLHGGHYIGAGVRWGDGDDQGFGFVHVQVEMPVRHPHGDVKEALG